uniref:AT-rich interactive domain-containing protein 3 n=1 Tax=Periophthalmus magnuspinnatus TaxID=409849 RepID=A0A3B3Z819_9GOBI
MVDNSGSSKAQMPSMSQESGVAFPQSTSTGGMKLEAVMEQLQRQQQARLEMERKERKLREAHIMYAQQVAAQQAILAAARASGAGFMGKGMAGGVPGGGLPPRMSNQSSVDSEREDDEDRGRDSGEDDDDTEMMEGDEGSDDEGSASGLEFLRKQTLALQQSASRIPARSFGSYSASVPQRVASPPVRVKQEPDEGLSPAGAHSATSPNGQADWGFDDHFRQNGSAGWADEADSSRGRGEASRDFAKLYELDNDPKRKEFLDDLFTFMQKRGKSSFLTCLMFISYLAFAITCYIDVYMKYLYPYECERKGLSSPGELQAAIDSNRREGRRPSYSNSLFRFSPSPSTAPHILSPPKMHLSALGAGAAGALNGLQPSPGPSLKKEDLTPSIIAARPSMALALGQQQVAGLARAATLEQLREKLETSGGVEGPERKMARLAEEQQRLMQQAFQHNLLAMASQMPMNLRLAAPPITAREKPQDMSLSISTNGNASITVSVEVNGTTYSGLSVYVVAILPVSAHTLSPSSSSSSKGPGSAEPLSGGSP